MTLKAVTNGHPAQHVQSVEDAQALSIMLDRGVDVYDAAGRVVAAVAPNPDATKVMPWYKGDNNVAR